MSSTHSWTIVCLLGLISITSGRTCRWLSLSQEHVTNQILSKMKDMIPAEDPPRVCPYSSVDLPDLSKLFQISQVEAAAIAVRDVTIRTVQFYSRHQERLGYSRSAWEDFTDLCKKQERQLSGCIPAGAENQQFTQEMAQRITTLENILKEQEDETCAWRIVHADIRRNLLLAAQLTSRLRKLHLRRR